MLHVPWNAPINELYIRRKFVCIVRVRVPLPRPRLQPAEYIAASPIRSMWSGPAQAAHGYPLSMEDDGHRVCVGDWSATNLCSASEALPGASLHDIKWTLKLVQPHLIQMVQDLWDTRWAMGHTYRSTGTGHPTTTPSSALLCCCRR